MNMLNSLSSQDDPSDVSLKALLMLMEVTMKIVQMLIGSMLQKGTPQNTVNSQPAQMKKPVKLQQKPVVPPVAAPVTPPVVPPVVPVEAVEAVEAVDVSKPPLLVNPHTTRVPRRKPKIQSVGDVEIEISDISGNIG